MVQQSRKIECVGGGPRDGEWVTVSAEHGAYPVLLRIDNDGNAHYYVAVPRDGEEKFVHAGSDAEGVIMLIAETDPAAAATIAAELAEQDADYD